MTIRTGQKSKHDQGLNDKTMDALNVGVFLFNTENAG